MRRLLSVLLAALLLLPLLALPAEAAGEVWDGTVDISWYDPDASEYYLSTPAQLAGLAALVNGMTDPECPAVIGDRSLLRSVRVDDYMLVGAGGGNVSDTVYTGGLDFAYKTVYLTADMDMGGVFSDGTWSGPNWTPVGGKFPMKPQEVRGDCLTLDTRFNGVLDGQGHTIRNLYCDRYAAKGFPYSMAIGVVGFLGGVSDTASGSGAAQFTGGWQPAVRNLVLGSGSILGRRMVGGVVGRIGNTSDGVIVENCGNCARVKSTDAKGVGGIVGSAWGDGVIRGCYNTGYITTTYSSPAGGIVGTNEGMDIYNCYNAGTIDTNGQQRGRGIGSHDTGVYTVDNCFTLAGSGDDPDNPGYYKGISTKIRVSVTVVTAQELRGADVLGRLNANGAVFAADTGGVNGGYPVLRFQNGAGGGRCSVSVQQAAGGTISASCGAEVPFGQTVTLSCQAEPGYTLEYFTLNGRPIASDFFAATENATVSASFKKLRTVTVTIPEPDACSLSVAREGWTLRGGELVQTERELLRSGDTLVEGNRLTLLFHGYPDASPADADLEYVDAYSCTLTGAEKNADGSYTVTGEEDVAIRVERSTQAKTWLSLADTDWYVRGGRKSEYTISTPEELAGLAYLVDRLGVSFEGLTIRLGADVSLRNADGTDGARRWSPIGTNLKNAFSGVFDGQGHAVYDMDAVSDSSYAGLFGVCVGAVIRDLSVYGSVRGTARASYAAGVAAYFSGGSIENCSSYASVDAFGTHAGGIAALLRDGAKLSGCFNYGSVTGVSGIGGLVGVSDSGDDRIDGCANFGAVTSVGSGTYGTGGLVGRLAGEISRSANYGAVSGTDRYTGGLAGYAASRNHSAVTVSANRAAVTADNSLATAALGGLVGYAQYLRLCGAENTGTVLPGAAFPAANAGAEIGREGSVTREESGEPVPEYEAQAAKQFPDTRKDSYTVTFTADGAVVGTAVFRPGDTAVIEPPVPQKEGCTASWERYTLAERDLTVRAVYRQRLVRSGDTVTENGTYFIAWFSTGEISVAPGVQAVLDGSNGGSEGFEGLALRVGEGASLTLRDTVLRGETTLLTFEGGNTLTLSGSSRLLSRADAQDNAQPTVRLQGDLRIDGEGSLYVTAGIRNAAVYLNRPGSVLTMLGGTLCVYKEDLLGFAGGAVCLDGSRFELRGGELRGHTVSDNVAVLSAERVSMSGGRMLLQCERAPAVILGAVSASGGEIAAWGHSGNSAAAVREYVGREAIPDYGGSAAFIPLLPFADVFVTDDCYDAVAACYERRYFDGTSDTTFSPDKSMNRAMFVTVLYRLAGKPAVTESTPFADLTQDWYRDAVAWAVAAGITDGTSDTTFSPTAPVTREQSAVFLYRYAQQAGQYLPLRNGASTAHGELSAWAEAEALWALSGGLFDGVADAMRAPGDFAPRSLLAQVLINYDLYIR